MSTPTTVHGARVAASHQPASDGNWRNDVYTILEWTDKPDITRTHYLSGEAVHTLADLLKAIGKIPE